MRSILKLLFGWIKPDFYYESVFDIDLGELKKNGVKNLLIDLDNTLVPWGEDKVTEHLIKWLKDLQQDGFSICILSNNIEKRASNLSKMTGLPYIALARKPAKRAFELGLKKIDADKRQAAVIGDQIFTDILGGKRTGLKTVLVVPLSKNEFWGTKIVRKFEKLVLKTLYG